MSTAPAVTVTMSSRASGKAVTFSPSKSLQLFAQAGNNPSILTIADSATSTITIPRSLYSVICSLSNGKSKERVSYNRTELPATIQLSPDNQTTIEATNVNVSEHTVSYLDNKGTMTVVKAPYFKVQRSLNDTITINTSSSSSVNSSSSSVNSSNSSSVNSSNSSSNSSSASSTNNNTSNNVAVIGKLDNLYWSPTYIVTLDTNFAITNLSLLAEIINGNEKLEHIRSITFSLMSLTDREANSFNTTAVPSAMPGAVRKMAANRSAAVLSQESYELAQGIEEESDYSYTTNGNFTINKETAIPLWSETMSPAVAETAYLFVGKDKVFAGYNIEVKPTMYLPTGSVTLMKDKSVYKEVTMPRPVVNDLRIIAATIPEISVTSDNTFNEQETMSQVKLQYTLHHSTDIVDSIRTIQLVMPTSYNKITINQDQPQHKQDKDRREFVWVITLNPNSTTTNFSCEFVLGYTSV